MNVLLADAIDPAAVAALEAQGHTVSVQPDLTADTLAANIAGAEVLVVRSTKVIADVIAAGSQLALIVRAGAGVDNIDVEAASAAGVHVCNVPGRNAIAVAELAMGLLLAIDRHIAAATADLRNGVWNKKGYSKADGIFGQTVGIIGLGDIGLRFAERARAFGMTVVAQRKPGRSAAVEQQIRQIGIRLVDTVDDVVESSDVVSIHVPSNASTKGLMGAELLAKLRDGGVLLNTSRGDVVDEEALLEAMNSRGVRAGLDVFCGEPGAGDSEFASPIAQHRSVVGTHHIGASTNQASSSVADGVVETIQAFATGEPSNCVNLAPQGLGTHTVTVRHLDRVGVLASVFATMRSAGLNVANMQNRIFAGRTAAVASIEVTGDVPTELEAQLLELDNVLGVAVVEPAAS